MRKVERWVAQFQRFSDRSWYFPALGFLALLDYFIGIVPTDALLVTSVALRPKKWVRAAVFTAIGSALGSLLIAIVMRRFGPPALEWALGQGILDTPTWSKARVSLESQGVWALFAMALGPLPMVPMSVLAGLTGMPFGTIFWATLAGRGPKYLAFSWAASHAPKLLQRVLRPGSNPQKKP